MKPIKKLTHNEKEKIVYLIKELEKLKLGYIQIINKGKVIALMKNNNEWNVIVEYDSNFIYRYQLKDKNVDFIEGIRPE